MSQTLKLSLYLVGTLLMALPGVLTTGMRLYSIGLFAAGFFALVGATLKSGVSEPRAALLLVLFSNASFWLSYLLWLTRPKTVGPIPTVGIDPFAGPVSLWFLVFLVFSIYELLVFVISVSTNRARGQSILGLVATVTQAVLTMQVIYGLVKGV